MADGKTRTGAGLRTGDCDSAPVIRVAADARLGLARTSGHLPQIREIHVVARSLCAPIQQPADEMRRTRTPAGRRCCVDGRRNTAGHLQAGTAHYFQQQLQLRQSQALQRRHRVALGDLGVGRRRRLVAGSAPLVPVVAPPTPRPAAAVLLLVVGRRRDGGATGGGWPDHPALPQLRHDASPARAKHTGPCTTRASYSLIDYNGALSLPIQYSSC